MSPDVGRPSPPRIEALKDAAASIELESPELVASARAECVAGAEQDLVAGTPRGRAYVRRLRDLTVENPPLGVAVARSLGLEHIVEDLLQGTSVDGVTGISADGGVIRPSRSDRRRRRGVVLTVIGGVVLLAGATAADSLSLFPVILWTVASFALIFGGLRDILREK